ncbi:hypothetical protein [Pedobacter segetis]|nr:hypothetical protein [Pedobacter segetis]
MKLQKLRYTFVNDRGAKIELSSALYEKEVMFMTEKLLMFKLD